MLHKNIKKTYLFAENYYENGKCWKNGNGFGSVVRQKIDIILRAVMIKMEIEIVKISNDAIFLKKVVKSNWKQHKFC